MQDIKKILSAYPDVVETSNKYIKCYATFPVSKGHTVYIATGIDNLAACFEAAITDGNQLKDCGAIHGYNVGLNCGEAAGEEYDWPHVHMIPRRNGDCRNYFGGIRKVIDGQSDYTIASYQHPENKDVEELKQAISLEFHSKNFSLLFGSGDVPGMLSDEDMQAINFLSQRLPESGTLVEIGSLMGKSAIEWARNFNNQQKTYNLLCIDTFNAGITVLSDLLQKSDFEVPINATSQLDLFKYYTREYPNIQALPAFFDKSFQFDKNVDCVFEDSDHTKKTLDHSLCFWWDRLNTGGILCGHDYGPVTDEVRVAVDLFAWEHNVRVNTFTNGSSIWWIEKNA